MDDWLARHHRGDRSVDELNDEIAVVWRESLADPIRRGWIAQALEVDVDQLGEDSPAPVEVGERAGFSPDVLVVVAIWVATDIIAPALVDLAREEVKRRIKSLWLDVILPEVRKRDHSAIKGDIDDEPTP